MIRVNPGLSANRKQSSRPALDRRRLPQQLGSQNRNPDRADNYRLANGVGGSGSNQYNSVRHACVGRAFLLAARGVQPFSKAMSALLRRRRVPYVNLQLILHLASQIMELMNLLRGFRGEFGDLKRQVAV